MNDKVDAVQESIKLALDAADAATDVTSEYNTVRKQHKILEDKVKQIHKYTTVVFVSSIVSGIFVVIVSAFLFMHGSSKLDTMTETSREALVVFAENVDSVNKSLESLNKAINKQDEFLVRNKKVIATMNKMEKKITESNKLTAAELRTISNSLVSELDTFSKNSVKNNNELKYSPFKPIRISSSFNLRLYAVEKIFTFLIFKNFLLNSFCSSLIEFDVSLFSIKFF